MYCQILPLTSYASYLRIGRGDLRLFTCEQESLTTQITLETLVVIIFLVSVNAYAARKLPGLVEFTLHLRPRVSSGLHY